MKLSMQKAYGGAAGLLLLAVILVAANVIVAQLRLRLDLSAEKLYTLSDGSRQVLASLQKPVTLKYFFSRGSGDVDTFLKTYATQVENLLREYVRASNGMLTLEVYDPAPDSDEEEWAQQYRIEPQLVGMDVPPMYFGLAAVSADGSSELSIPGFTPRTEATLEYDITRMITRVANPRKPVVGVLSTLPVLGEPQDPMAAMMGRQPASKPWFAFRELRRDVELRPVEWDVEELDPDLSALIVVHPKALPDQTLYAIDQFLLGGGRLIVFVDPFSLFEAVNSPQDQQQMMMGGPSYASNLDRLFAVWGVSFDASRIVADMQYPTMLRGPAGPEENPCFLSLTRSAFHAEDMLVSQWGSLLFPFAGAFTILPRQNVTATPLIQTSDTAGLVDSMTAQFGAQAVRSQFVADGVRRALVVRLSGLFSSAFPGGPPREGTLEEGEAQDGEVELSGHLASGESMVLLFGDTDLLQDDVCVRLNPMFGANVPTLVSDNINLLVSAVEQASGDSALLAVRARGRTARPFTVVDRLERQAQLEFLEKEQELEGKLNATRERLRELQTKRTDDQQRFILSREQQAEIARFREEERRFRRELRDVRRSLHQEIEALGVRVKALNILAVPLLVGVAGVLQGVRRRSA